MKKLLKIFTTLIILFILSFGTAYFTNTKVIDITFFVGVIVTVIIWFFSSKGGITSHSLDMQVQSTTGYKIEQQRYKFSPTITFLTSLIYTIISLIVLLIYYKDYLL
ncbi:hypothetical protein [Heyndrickxia oleronia]|uniref:hypothetical protein n=1 Tax=Heyndrickxia oleronia TaxID=38875 RepID=UPI001B0AC8DF|nr:hypothetical protein [Heyndrickxia oleronia]GIN38065.1 hypothetical protein J19TS1_10140 [Heyndrickxia oleronia]